MNILVIGHIDHGKTTFTCAINSLLFYKYGIGNEEGILPTALGTNIVTTKRSFSFSMGGTDYQYTDYPSILDYQDMFEKGEEKYDAAVLVCAVTDGPMPETKESLKLCAKHGISKLVIFANKMDNVFDPELADIVIEEICFLAEECGYSYDTPVVKGSAFKALEDRNEKCEQSIMDVLTAVHKICTE